MARKKRTVESCIKEIMKLPCDDADGLLDSLGYKGPRDNAALAAAVIFNKAQSGDMNCLREIMRICQQEAASDGGAVRIIDDVK